MIRGLRALGALAVLALAAPAATTAFAQSDGGPEFKAADVIRSTVRVKVVDKKGAVTYGAGLIISGADDQNRAGAAIVMTSASVVAGADRVSIIPSDAAELTARLRSTKPETKTDYDVAFIEVKGLEQLPAYKVAHAIPDPARPVYSLGYSNTLDNQKGMAPSASLQSGTLSTSFQGGMVRASKDRVDQIEHNTPLEKGFAGGPLLDRCGRLIGMNTLDGGIQNIGEAGGNIPRGTVFALASTEIIAVAGKEGIPIDTVPGACGSSAVQPGQAGGPAVMPGGTEASKGVVQNANFIQALGDFFRANPSYLIIIIVVALAALGLGVWLLMTGRKTTSPPTETVIEVPPTGPGATTIQPTASPVLELSGHGPEGEALNFRFSADDLASGGAVMGSERGKVDAALDNRPDYRVSRSHARLGFDGRNFTIEDNKSANGTKVGGVKLEPHHTRAIMDGDEIELADVKMRVSVR